MKTKTYLTFVISAFLAIVSPLWAEGGAGGGGGSAGGGGGATGTAAPGSGAVSAPSDNAVAPGDGTTGAPGNNAVAPGDSQSTPGGGGGFMPGGGVTGGAAGTTVPPAVAPGQLPAERNLAPNTGSRPSFGRSGADVQAQPVPEQDFQLERGADSPALNAPGGTDPAEADLPFETGEAEREPDRISDPIDQEEVP